MCRNSKIRNSQRLFWERITDEDKCRESWRNRERQIEAKRKRQTDSERRIKRERATEI